MAQPNPARVEERRGLTAMRGLAANLTTDPELRDDCISVGLEAHLVHGRCFRNCQLRMFNVIRAGRRRRAREILVLDAPIETDDPYNHRHIEPIDHRTPHDVLVEKEFGAFVEHEILGPARPNTRRALEKRLGLVDGTLTPAERRDLSEDREKLARIWKRWAA